jgi:hypothetical protein
MSPKSLYLLGAIVGGTIGGFVPDLWHAGAFSGWGILCSTLGGLAGIWLAYRYAVN